MRQAHFVSVVASLAFLVTGCSGGVGGLTGSSGSGGVPDAAGGGQGGNGSGGSIASTTVGTGGISGLGGRTGSGGATAVTTGGVSGSGGLTGSGGAGASTGGAGAAPGTGGGVGGRSGTGGSGGATAPADAGPGSDTGTGGTSGCDKDLTGTWDLYASSLGAGVAGGVLVVSVDGFSLTSMGKQLTYNAQGTKSATWKTPGGGTRAITVQNTPSSVNSGSVPLALGGHWVLKSNSETCTLDVASGTVAGNCTGRAIDYNVAGDDWPWSLLPSPENGVHYNISRSTTLTSQFGDFGGNWTARSDTGSGQGCTFKLDGNSATTVCSANNDFNGTLHLTVGSDCVASGVSPGGLEFSARRR